MTLTESSGNTLTPTIGLKKGTGSFADNALTLTGGAAFAFGMTMLASPLTSRLFGPKAFGLAALFMSGATMIGMNACLRYEMAIVLPKDDEDASPLFALCCLALMVTTTLTIILTFVFGTRALLYLGGAELKPYLWFFPIYVFLEGSRLLLNQWHSRHKRFKVLAAGQILISFPTALAEIGGGWAGLRTGGNLVVIRAICLIISPVFLLWRLSNIDVRFIIRNINPSEILKSAKRYIKFPLLDSLSTLLLQLSWHAPIILLSAFFSPAVGGLYTKAVYLLYLPSLIIGQSVGQVFLRESAISKAEGESLAGLVEAVFNRMITIGILPFAMLLIIGPELFGLFLGARWTEAGIYAQIMTPWLFIAFLTGSIATLFGTLAKQELNLISNGLLLILRVGALIWGGLQLCDVRLTLFILMVSSVLILFWRYYLLMRASRLSATRPLSHFMRCTAYVVPSVIFVAALKWWLCLEPAYLVALVPVYSIPYGLFVLRNDLEIRHLLVKALRKIQSLL